MPRAKRPAQDNGPFGKPYGPPQSAEVYEISAATWQFRSLLEAVVLSRFKWSGLPDTVSERYLERTLMSKGQAVAFMSTTGIAMALHGTSARMNVYGDPLDYNVIGENGWQEKVEEGKGVWIWDTNTHYCTYPIILRYARKLGNLDILQDANRDQQRQVVVFAGTENNQQDLMQLARAMRMNEHSVMVDAELIDNNPVRVLQTGVQYLQEDFNADKRSLINEFFDHFGIEHIAFEKTAHLLESEANVTNDSVARIRENGLLPRQLAAIEMSKLFGTEITVEWRNDQYDILKDSDTSKKMDGNND